MIKQEELLKKISENENEEELFVKKPTPAIIVTKDNVKSSSGFLFDFDSYMIIKKFLLKKPINKKIKVITL